jgi:hypothetical protein
MSGWQMLDARARLAATINRSTAIGRGKGHIFHGLPLMAFFKRDTALDDSGEEIEMAPVIDVDDMPDEKMSKENDVGDLEVGLP